MKLRVRKNKENLLFSLGAHSFSGRILPYGITAMLYYVPSIAKPFCGAYCLQLDVSSSPAACSSLQNGDPNRDSLLSV